MGSESLAVKTKLRKLTREDQRVLHRDPLTMDWLLYELGRGANYEFVRRFTLDDMIRSKNDTERGDLFYAGRALKSLITEHRRRVLEKQICDGEFFL